MYLKRTAKQNINVEDGYIKGQNFRHFGASSYGRGSEVDPEVIDRKSHIKTARIAFIILVAAIGIPVLFMKPSIQGFTILGQGASTKTGFIGLVIASLTISIVIVEVFGRTVWEKQAYKENIKTTERLLRKAEDLLKDKKYGRAITLYDRILLKEPSNKRILLNKGFVYDEMGDYEAAVKEYDKILKTNPKNSKALYNKGVALLELDNLTDAFNTFSKALKSNKKDIPTMRKICFILFSKQQYVDVVSLCDKALEFDKKNVDMLIIKGLSLEHMGKRAPAVKCFNEALKIDPTDAWAFKCKHEILRK